MVMRPWIIAVTSAGIAVLAGAALVRPELALTSRSTLLTSLPPVLPTFAVTVLAVYGLCAIWLSAASVIALTVSQRRRCERLAADPAGADRDALAGGLCRRLSLPSAAPGLAGALSRIGPAEMRREIVHLYYLAAARGQFFSALIVLAAVVVVGAAQQQGALRVVFAPIPTVAAALALAGLVLLAFLARIAVDISAEPLIDAIGRFPVEPSRAELVDRATARLEAAAAILERRPLPAPPTATTPDLPDRLVAVVESSQQALGAASERLAVTADRFATATTAAIDTFAETLRVLPQRATGEDGTATVVAIGQLHDAVVHLTSLLQQRRSAPAAADTTAADTTAADTTAADTTAADTTAAPARSAREPLPDLAEELRKLLQEIETAP
jgi:hypothetical protein